MSTLKCHLLKKIKKKNWNVLFHIWNSAFEKPLNIKTTTQILLMLPNAVPAYCYCRLVKLKCYSKAR